VIEKKDRERESERDRERLRKKRERERERAREISDSYRQQIGIDTIHTVRYVYTDVFNKDNDFRFNYSIPCNSIQFNSIQFNSIQFNSII